jgi:hypothetical protein
MRERETERKSEMKKGREKERESARAIYIYVRMYMYTSECVREGEPSRAGVSFSYSTTKRSKKAFGWGLSQRINMAHDSSTVRAS